jgi:hypothetical protein
LCGGVEGLEGIRKIKIKREKTEKAFQFEEIQYGKADYFEVAGILVQAEPHSPLDILTNSIEKIRIDDYLADYSSCIAAHPLIAFRDPNGRTRLIINVKELQWYKVTDFYIIDLPPLSEF